MAGILQRIKSSWDVFTNQEETRKKIQEFKLKTPQDSFSSYGSFGTGRSSRIRPNHSVERTVISSIYTRMSVDGSGLKIKHIVRDEKGRYKQDAVSKLNDCLTVSANIDQPARMFRQDLILSCLSKGTIAIVPVEITGDPLKTMSYDIQTLRVAEILEWFPATVKVSVYNHFTGNRQEMELPKEFVAVVENPFYAVMNAPSSTLQRLNHKLNLLDVTDENTSSGKLDLIIQLPYTIRSEARRAQAEDRRKEIEFQLRSSKYGIAYADGTENITQLNRPVENNLLKQVEYLTELLYSQLGITKEILDGTASEDVMANYYARTIYPIVEAICESMHRTFLTPTARTQGHAIDFFIDPFKLLSASKMAEIADKLSRNEITTPNELRAGMGLPPSGDPKSDKLVNSNMPQEKTQPTPNPDQVVVSGEVVNEETSPVKD